MIDKQIENRELVLRNQAKPIKKVPYKLGVNRKEMNKKRGPSLLRSDLPASGFSQARTKFVSEFSALESNVTGVNEGGGGGTIAN